MIEIKKKWRMVFLGSILGAILLRPVEGPAQAQVEDAQAQVQRYFDSEYTYCDAELLAQYWQEGLEEAKARMGRKIGWGDQAILEEELASARQKADRETFEACSFHNSEFSFEDVERLAEFWGVSIGDAKAEVGKALFDGQASSIRNKLAGISSAEQEGEPEDAAQDAAGVFWSKGYTYCDARLVAEAWDVDVWDAKVQIGNKIMELGTDMADETFEVLRNEVPEGFSCYYTDEGYTYDDMVELADFWDSTIEETKTIVENKLLWGLNENIQEALREIRR